MIYHWRAAQLIDIDPMLVITRRDYFTELNQVLTIDMDKLAETVAHEIIQQSFRPESTLIQVIEREDQIVGWTWINRGVTTDYIREEIAEAHMLHLDLSLSVRDRIRLVRETLDCWIDWCRICQIPVLASTTVRSEWETFMRIHRQRGFLVHGSHAFYDVRKEPGYV